jgi:uncharacterized HhH-GPD family protein
MTPTLHITGDHASDELLSSDPLALLIGMLLDQQVPMETAFAGPQKILTRLGDATHHQLGAEELANYDAGKLVDLFRISPSVHRFPGSMAGRVQGMCAAIVADWGGEASNIWMSGSPDGAEVLARLNALPGFGEQKAKIFLALLGKQYGFDGAGWRAAAGDYGIQGSYRSVADIVDPGSLTKVREFKRAAKATAKLR